ncbi:hypothetical protein HMPREF0083_03978 [Aneurinibacillus aneurinilyticus ATCC 12856]|uniref:Uncharacterized protein n=1 Tax=Aneurinibacillus aneurinilyticus ATCC 12856 TaxID=649747 RepID=U1WZ42_ANEAE|nr:hypothetical protein HMPREF0083_03978 [Aneurinibacillus aneurinilyticus ATCC 12856]
MLNVHFTINKHPFFSRAYDVVKATVLIARPPGKGPTWTLSVYIYAQPSTGHGTLCHGFFVLYNIKGVDYPVRSRVDSHHTVPQTGVGPALATRASPILQYMDNELV